MKTNSEVGEPHTDAERKVVALEEQLDKLRDEIDALRLGTGILCWHNFGDNR